MAQQRKSLMSHCVCVCVCVCPCTCSVLLSDKDHCSSSYTDPEVLPEKVEPSNERLSKEMELPSHTESGKDHHSSSDEQDALLGETEISSLSGSDKEYQPSSTPSSSEDEMPSDESKSSSHSVAEQQTTKDGSSLRGNGTKRRTKQVTVKTSKKKDGGQTRDKAQNCLYCRKSNLKMARHLQRKLTLPTPSISHLAPNKGRHSWNLFTIRATGSLMLKS